MGSRCCIRKDANSNLEFNAGREDLLFRVKSAENVMKMSKIQAIYKGNKLREKLRSKLIILMRRSSRKSDVMNLLEKVRSGVREITPGDHFPLLDGNVQDILNNIGPFMIDEKELPMITNNKLIKLGQF